MCLGVEIQGLGVKSPNPLRCGTAHQKPPKLHTGLPAYKPAPEQTCTGRRVKPSLTFLLGGNEPSDHPEKAGTPPALHLTWRGQTPGRFFSLPGITASPFWSFWPEGYCKTGIRLTLIPLWEGANILLHEPWVIFVQRLMAQGESLRLICSWETFTYAE